MNREGLDLPEDEKDSTMKDKLQCVLRNFILQSAYDHGCYDAKRHIVALPVVVLSTSENPNHKVHYHCTECPELEDEQLKECDFQNEAQTRANE